MKFQKRVGGQSNVHDCPRKVGRWSVECPRGPVKNLQRSFECSEIVFVRSQDSV